MDQRPSHAVSRRAPSRRSLRPEEPRCAQVGAAAWADDDGGVHRVYVAKVGPFGFILMALVLAAIAAVVAIFVVGAFLIVIPLAGLLLAAAIIVGLWRGPFRRTR